MIEIPYDRLSSEALDALVDAFVLREGTDYGEREFSLAEKRVQVKRQIAAGRVLIYFDPASQSCNLVPVEQ